MLAILVIATCLNAGCRADSGEPKLVVELQIETMVPVLLDDNISDSVQLRTEVLRHVRTDWESSGRSQTNWTAVRSVVGSEGDASVDSPNTLSITSVRSTPWFRLRKRGDGMVTVEIREDDGSIREQAETNSSAWDVFEVLLASPLNDSLLHSILSNE